MKRVEPGTCTVVWASNGAVAAVARDRVLLARLRPPIVMLHVSLGDPAADVTQGLEDLRALLPDVRLWLALGGNPLATMDLAALERAGTAWAVFARDHGCELLMLNLEQDDPPKVPHTDPVTGAVTMVKPPPRPFHGWNLRQWPGRERELREKARALVDACAAVLPLGLTSHDCPQYFELPWPELVGASSPLVLAAWQHYPGRTGGATLREMRARIDELSASGWGYRVRAGQVAARYAPRGECWAGYFQTYSVQCAALTWGADQSQVTVLGWTLGDAEPDGLRALEVVLRARRETGLEAGAVAELQRRHGLTPDSAAGPLTLAALGIV